MIYEPTGPDVPLSQGDIFDECPLIYYGLGCDGGTSGSERVIQRAGDHSHAGLRPGKLEDVQGAGLKRESLEP